MAFVSPEYVKNMQLQHSCPYWKVTDRTKKLVINRNESSVLNTSIDQLQETLSNCQGDYVCVTLYTVKPEKTETDTKRGQMFDLMVKLNDPFVNVPQKGISGAPTFSDLLALHSKIQQYEIEKIKSQYEAASEQKETAFDRLINKLVEGDNVNTLISVLLAKMNKPAKQTAAISAPADDSLATAFTKMEAVDPDYKNTLVKMAEYLHKNPAVLPQIKAIIGA
jgi:hypothetical protein